MRTNPYHSLFQHSFDLGTAPYRSISWIWTISHVLLVYTGLKGFAKGVRGFDQVDLEVDFPVKDLIEDFVIYKPFEFASSSLTLPLLDTLLHIYLRFKGCFHPGCIACRI